MIKCLRCHRKLTNPRSVARQYGPVCWKKIESRARRLVEVFA